jgi:hypothetical protein
VHDKQVKEWRNNAFIKSTGEIQGDPELHDGFDLLITFL